jgi:hypothetical protein
VAGGASVVADAELVAFGISHQGPGAAVFAGCVVADSLCAKTAQAVGFDLDTGNLDVEVHPILGRLWFGHSLQEQLRAVAFAQVQRDVHPGSADVGVAQRLGPEFGEAFRTSAVEYESEMRCRIVVGHGRDHHLLNAHQKPIVAPASIVDQ